MISLPSSSPTIGVIAINGKLEVGLVPYLAADWLTEFLGTGPTITVGDSSHYDLTRQRPVRDAGPDGTSLMTRYPSIELSTALVHNIQWCLVTGPEPHFGWEKAAARIQQKLGHCDLIAILSSVPANVAHTLPLRVVRRAPDPQLATRFGIANVRPETDLGDVTFSDVLAQRLSTADVPTVNLQVDVPMYVADGQCPKAVLALLHDLDGLVEAGFDTRELSDQAHAWESGVDELVRNEPELGVWVARLEKHTDPAQLPEAQGDFIAAEFERFLKSRDRK